MEATSTQRPSRPIELSFRISIGISSVGSKCGSVSPYPLKTRFQATSMILFDTGLSKRSAAKFRELSQKFPKLADWAVPGRTGAESFQMAQFLMHTPLCTAGIF